MFYKLTNQKTKKERKERNSKSNALLTKLIGVNIKQ